MPLKRPKRICITSRAQRARRAERLELERLLPRVLNRDIHTAEVGLLNGPQLVRRRRQSQRFLLSKPDVAEAIKRIVAVDNHGTLHAGARYYPASHLLGALDVVHQMMLAERFHRQLLYRPGPTLDFRPRPRLDPGPFRIEPLKIDWVVLDDPGLVDQNQLQEHMRDQILSTYGVTPEQLGQSKPYNTTIHPVPLPPKLPGKPLLHLLDLATQLCEDVDWYKSYRGINPASPVLTRARHLRERIRVAREGLEFSNLNAIARDASAVGRGLAALEELLDAAVPRRGTATFATWQQALQEYHALPQAQKDE